MSHRATAGGQAPWWRAHRLNLRSSRRSASFWAVFAPFSSGLWIAIALSVVYGALVLLDGLRRSSQELSFHTDTDGLSLGMKDLEKSLGQNPWRARMPHMFLGPDNTRGAERALPYGVDQGKLVRQQKLELRAVEDAAERYRKDWESAKERGALGQVGAGKDLLVRWFGPLRDAIAEEQRAILREEKARATEDWLGMVNMRIQRPSTRI